MTHRPLRPLLLAAALLAAARPAAAQDPAAAPVAPALAAATFDSAWSRIDRTYHDSTFGGRSWAAVRDELRPRAAAARTTGELRAVLGEMLGRLGESHFVVIPREAADALDTDDPQARVEGVPADPGLDLRLVDGRLLVTAVRPGSPAARAGVRTGWAVDSVGAWDGAERARRVAAMTGVEAAQGAIALPQIALGRMQGAEGSAVAVVLRDGGDRPVRLSLVRERPAGEMIRFGNLPPMLARLEHERIEGEGGCVGVIRFTVWMPALAAPFDRAVDALRDCRGIVIDLRGNPGGVAGMIMGASGHFLDTAVPLGIMKTRTSTLRLMANPRRARTDGTPAAPFAGPVAVLVDGLSMSTSEFFAAGLQAHGRARVFGERSPGYALPALMVRLPNQDVLMHAWADYTGPTGARIEGVGVVPDQAVPLERAALLAGRDAARDAAVAWIRARPR